MLWTELGKQSCFHFPRLSTLSHYLCLSSEKELESYLSFPVCLFDCQQQDDSSNLYFKGYLHNNTVHTKLSAKLGTDFLKRKEIGDHLLNVDVGLPVCLSFGF